MTTKTVSTQRTTVTTNEVNQDPSAKSIRQIALAGIIGGKDTATIAAEIQAAYPTSAGALKSKKHIAWYRSWIKKNPNDKAVVALRAAE